ELGAFVLCFDSDAPRSKRFCFFGTDDATCGAMVMKELAGSMEGSGSIAILAGNQTAPNLQKRVDGVKRELARHPGISLVEDGVFHHPETPEQAAETINRAQTTSPEIGGWAMVGGWPLFTRDALRWEPGSVKVVAVDALPAQLAYLESGHVEVLLAQDCYGWGYRSVEILLARILDGKDPEGGPKLFDPLRRVRKADVTEYRRNWARWLGRR
ncbi:MAG: substrate-binding domain-containing protein, partial [Planctomycetota bacterium]